METGTNTSLVLAALLGALLNPFDPAIANAQSSDSSRVRTDAASSDSALKALVVALEESRTRAAKEVEQLQLRVDAANSTLREEIARGAKSDAASQVATRRLFTAFENRLRALEARDSVARSSIRSDRLDRLIAGERLAIRLSGDGKLLSTTADAIQLSAMTAELSNPFTYAGFVTLKDSLITTFEKPQRPLLLGLVDRIRDNYAQQPVAAALDPLVTLLAGPKPNKKRQLDIYEWQREFLCVATAAKALADQQNALASLTVTLQSRATELRKAADSSSGLFWSSARHTPNSAAGQGYESYLRELAQKTPIAFDTIRTDLALFSIGSVASKFEDVSFAASNFLDGYRQFLNAAQVLGSKCATINNLLAARAKDMGIALAKLEASLAPAIRDGTDPSAITRTQLLAALRSR